MGKWIEQPLGSLIIEDKKSPIQVQGASNFGDYPFFTSGENVLIHDNYLVDGENLFLATGGKANIKYYNGRAAYSTDTYVISSEKANTLYIFYFLLNQIEFINSNLFTGSGLKHLQKKDFKKIRVTIPEEKIEQARIAQILSKADAAITQTEALIAKYQRIKTGLMQDLFTLGIDQHGNIRSKATHKFVIKNGIEVPEEWKVRTIDEHCITSAFGPRFPGSLYSTEGNIGTLRTTDIDVEGNINYSTIPLANLNGKLFSRHLLKKDDLLITRSGTVGLVSVYKEQSFPVIPGAFLIRFRFKSSLKPEFIRYFFRNELGKRRLLDIAEGGVQKNIRGSAALKLFVPIPKENEQLEIIKRLDKIQNYIDSQVDSFHKLLSLKTGLMQDLLSGKVRVKTKEVVTA